MRKKTKIDFLHQLKEKREKIDLLDKKLLSLLNRRLHIAMEIGRIKKEMGRKIYDPKREREVWERLKIKNKGPLKDEDLKKIFEAITGACRRSQFP